MGYGVTPLYNVAYARERRQVCLASASCWCKSCSQANAGDECCKEVMLEAWKESSTRHRGTMVYRFVVRCGVAALCAAASSSWRWYFLRLQGAFLEVATACHRHRPAGVRSDLPTPWWGSKRRGRHAVRHMRSHRNEYSNNTGGGGYCPVRLNL